MPQDRDRVDWENALEACERVQEACRALQRQTMENLERDAQRQQGANEEEPGTRRRKDLFSSCPAICMRASEVAFFDYQSSLVCGCAASHLAHQRHFVVLFPRCSSQLSATPPPSPTATYIRRLPRSLSIWIFYPTTKTGPWRDSQLLLQQRELRWRMRYLTTGMEFSSGDSTVRRPQPFVVLILDRTPRSICKSRCIARVGVAMRNRKSRMLQYSSLHPLNTRRTPVEHPPNTPRTPPEHHPNTSRTPPEHPPIEHHPNTPRTPPEHHPNTPRTPPEHPPNTIRTPSEHHPNTTRTPPEHHPNTIRTPPNTTRTPPEHPRTVELVSSS